MNIIDPAAIDLAALVHTLAWTLLHFLWQGCALAAAFALTLLALRRARPAVRYLAGCVTLVMMAATPIATFAWLWSHTLAATTLRVVTLDAERPGTVLTTAPPQAEIDQKLLGLVLVWGVGAAACMVWVMGGWMQTHRLRRIDAIEPSQRMHSMIVALSRTLGVSAAVRIVDHAAIAVPMTLGMIKPIILIPAAMLTSLSPAHLEAIIAHEMAHVRRLDFLVNLLQAMVEALLFYHPAVWWVSRQVRQEREFCCDDVAAATCGNRITYARALAELEALRGASLAGRLGLSSQGGSLMKRIIRLVGEDREIGGGSAAGVRRSRLAASAAGAAMLAAASAAFALVQSPAPQTSPPTEAHDQVEANVAAQAHAEAYTAAVHAYFGRLHEAAAQVEVGLQREDGGGDALSVYAYLRRLHEAAAQGHVALEAEDGAFTLGSAGEPAEGVWMLADDVDFTGDVHVELKADPAVRAEGHWLLVADDAHVKGYTELVVRPRVLTLHGEMLQLAATPAIDPEKMPSEGLLRAAQYAYPFDLFSLTPWVDPNAQQVLVVPQVQPFLARPAEACDLELSLSHVIRVRAGAGIAVEVQPEIVSRRSVLQRAMLDLAPLVQDGEAAVAVETQGVSFEFVEATPSTPTEESEKSAPPADKPAPQPPSQAPAPPPETPQPQQPAPPALAKP